MGILGIKNSTENWKTAQTFAPFFSDESLRLELVRKLGDPLDTKPEDIQLELFPDLQSKIRDFRSDDGLTFEPLKPQNYQVSRPAGLRDNLKNTEIDIVLQTKERLYIGEAKDESGFHAGGSLILVHQLIRQYVVARILVNLTGDGKEVVPFIVRNEPKGREPAQVQFMVVQGWLKRENILIWSDIEKLTT